MSDEYKVPELDDETYFDNPPPEIREAHKLPTRPVDGETRYVRRARPVGPFGTGGERGPHVGKPIHQQVRPEGIEKEAVGRK